MFTLYVLCVEHKAAAFAVKGGSSALILETTEATRETESARFGVLRERALRAHKSNVNAIHLFMHKAAKKGENVYE